jgi:hypothetical protein
MQHFRLVASQIQHKRNPPAEGSVKMTTGWTTIVMAVVLGAAFALAGAAGKTNTNSLDREDSLAAFMQIKQLAVGIHRAPKAGMSRGRSV